jgi:hypothetical protein
MSNEILRHAGFYWVEDPDSGWKVRISGDRTISYADAEASFQIRFEIQVGVGKYVVAYIADLPDHPSLPRRELMNRIISASEFVNWPIWFI